MQERMRPHSPLTIGLVLGDKTKADLPHLSYTWMWRLGTASFKSQRCSTVMPGGDTGGMVW